MNDIIGPASFTDTKKRKVLTFKDFCTNNQMTDEEAEDCYRYLKAIRLMPHIEKLNELRVILKNI